MSLLEVFDNPSMIHAAVVHMPIGLGMAGMVLVYLCAVVAKENEPLRWVTVGCYTLMALSAFLAAQSGEEAVANASAELPRAIWDQIVRHEDMGKIVWKLAAITAALMALSAVKIRWFNMSVLTLAMLASLGTGAWVAVTGHYGGMLVYKYGIGTPAMQHVGLEQKATVSPPQPAPDPASFAAPVPDDGFRPPLLPFTIDEARQVSYARQILPLLKDVCKECHKPGKKRGGLDVTTVQALLQGGKKVGPAIIPGNPDASPIIKYLRGEMSPQMPKGEEPLEAEEVRLIRMWIAAGAVDDSGSGVGEETAPAPDAAASVPDKTPQSEETSGPAEAPAPDAIGSTPVETPSPDAANSSPAEAPAPDAATSEPSEAPSPDAASDNPAENALPDTAATSPSETPAPSPAAESEANP